jgi:predicted MFS family arabinose efflux permease
VTNAVALNATMFNVGKVLGPAAAGLSIGTIGLGAPFAFNALSYAVMTVCLLRIRPAEIHARDLGRAGPGALRAGLRYARRTPVLAATLALMTATGLVAYEWTTAVPLLARAHSADPASIGYFFAAMGVGAIAGSLALAGVLSSTPRTLLIGGAAFSLSLAVVAATPGMVLALAAMVVLGAAATTFRALATSLVQLEAEPAARGRMVSLLILALNGTSPVSGPLIGSMSELLGARVALAIGAGVSMLATAAAWRYLTAAAPDRLRPGDRMPVAS